MYNIIYQLIWTQHGTYYEMKTLLSLSIPYLCLSGGLLIDTNGCQCRRNFFIVAAAILPFKLWDNLITLVFNQ